MKYLGHKNNDNNIRLSVKSQRSTT